MFVTAQARTLDLATVLAQGSGLLVLVSPGMRQQLLERLDKHIFPGDQVWLCSNDNLTSLLETHCCWGSWTSTSSRGTR